MFLKDKNRRDGRPTPLVSPVLLSIFFGLTDGERHGTMVGAHHRWEDFGRGYARHKPLRHKEVVDAPAAVVVAGAEAVAPP